MPFCLKLYRESGTAKQCTLLSDRTARMELPADDGSVDVVLLMGPLYHLVDREDRVAALRGQLERFLDFGEGEGGAVMVNNLDWLGQWSLIDFLRDVGKHFTVPYMLSKDSVQVRLDRGLSFTEFSYMLLQAADFDHLHRTMGVELQMGGADQWGNIPAGLELIRRRGGVSAGAADPADRIPRGGGLGGDPPRRCGDLRQGQHRRRA